jgi:hypothetical protein
MKFSIVYNLQQSMRVWWKKIIGIIWILFLLLAWSNVFANEATCKGWPYQWNWIGNPGGEWSPTIWVCSCPDLTKYVQDRWCVSCAEKWICCGTKLNTKVPFIGDCIELAKKRCSSDSDCTVAWYACKKWSCKVTSTDPDETNITQEEAFPVLMWWLTRILLTVIVLSWFIMILAGWVMIASAWDNEGRARDGKKMIMSVIIAFAILGASGVILRLINPNFFM